MEEMKWNYFAAFFSQLGGSWGSGQGGGSGGGGGSQI